MTYSRFLYEVAVRFAFLLQLISTAPGKRSPVVLSYQSLVVLQYQIFAWSSQTSCLSSYFLHVLAPIGHHRCQNCSIRRHCWIQCTISFRTVDGKNIWRNCQLLRHSSLPSSLSSEHRELENHRR
ncbi:hypothetical protein BJ878DRAFT_14296 [Calycina marina]|uniref:Secreted protein n=1 Tax=Calycina marina TaxID=1763456 RepID=A0A9P7Z5X4_9HELO|nr:hypothetical protein BJ878DRAFT_14296 [Calycina marina]